MPPGRRRNGGPVIVREQVPLAGCTTLGLGGPAARFAEAATEADVVSAVRAADQRGEPVLVLGSGSNLVIADEGFDGTVVRVGTRGISEAPGGPDGLATVRVAAGEDWDGVVRWAIARGLSGLECLSGIPGLAGATPIQNVGAYGQEVSATIVAVRGWDRQAGEVARADCGRVRLRLPDQRVQGGRPGGPVRGAGGDLPAGPGSPVGAGPVRRAGPGPGRRGRRPGAAGRRPRGGAAAAPRQGHGARPGRPGHPQRGLVLHEPGPDAGPV